MLRKTAVFLIVVISGFFKAMNFRACRFAPSCSVYSTQAFNELGWAKAFVMSAKRLFRCHPFSPGGYDPLPMEDGRQN